MPRCETPDVRVEGSEHGEIVYSISAALFAKAVGARFDPQDPPVGRLFADMAWLMKHQIQLPIPGESKMSHFDDESTG